MSHFKKAKPIDAMKHFALFLLVLILSGVMALSHVSAGATTPSDSSIKLETLVPQRVLTIPKNDPSNYTPTQLGVRITNNTLTAFRVSLDSLTPEFMAVDGENFYAGKIQIGLVFRTESDFPLVRPGESLNLLWKGNFYWGNQNISLQIPDKYSNLWLFRGFKPGISKVRFTYTNAEAQRWYRDREKSESKQLMGVLTGNLSSPWTQFSFVLP
jgi:hypothetical protein